MRKVRATVARLPSYCCNQYMHKEWGSQKEAKMSKNMFLHLATSSYDVRFPQRKKNVSRNVIVILVIASCACAQILYHPCSILMIYFGFSKTSMLLLKQFHNFFSICNDLFLLSWSLSPPLIAGRTRAGPFEIELNPFESRDFCFQEEKCRH